ncbi:MAG: hypothetical protein HY040_14665 [Planctomycetes bacterium]|nr:hypothetical protein [Planctomycetota bacterium]
MSEKPTENAATLCGELGGACDSVKLTFKKPVSSDILEWARGLYTDDEILAGVREIQGKGGIGFATLIRTLEK